jgi:hypothetical protein
LALFGHIEIMHVMLADFDPGTLTAFYVICGAGVVAAICLVCGLVMVVLKKRKACFSWLSTAVIFVVLGILLAILSVSFGKRLGLL